MAMQKSPHTESGQNQSSAQSDLEPGGQEQQAGRGDDAALYENREGAQTGTNRGAQFTSGRDTHPNTEPTPVAQEGALKSRTGQEGGRGEPGSAVQGITSHASAEERERQKKVVQERPDAQAGTNRVA